jgi:hypothetical protein
MCRPAAVLLMQGGAGHDLVVVDGQEGKVALQIDVVTPVIDGLVLGDAVLEEEQLGGRNREKELVEALAIIRFERPGLAGEPAFEVQLFGKCVEGEFQ